MAISFVVLVTLVSCGNEAKKMSQGLIIICRIFIYYLFPLVDCLVVPATCGAIADCLCIRFASSLPCTRLAVASPSPPVALLPLAVAVPPLAIAVPPVAVVVPPVALLPLAVAMPPLAIVVPPVAVVVPPVAVVDCCVFITPLLDFDGAGRRWRHP
jgi:hypothetical protein